MELRSSNLAQGTQRSALHPQLREGPEPTGEGGGAQTSPPGAPNPIDRSCRPPHPVVVSL